MSIIKGMRRPNRSPSHPKMNAPSGRIMRVRVKAKVTRGIVRTKSWATGTKTKVRRKKSSASRVHPRKQAMKVLRCARLSDLNKRSASMLVQLVVMSSEVETSLNSKEFLDHVRIQKQDYSSAAGVISSGNRDISN